MKIFHERYELKEQDEITKLWKAFDYHDGNDKALRVYFNFNLNHLEQTSFLNKLQIHQFFKISDFFYEENDFVFVYPWFEKQDVFKIQIHPEKKIKILLELFQRLESFHAQGIIFKNLDSRYIYFDENLNVSFDYAALFIDQEFFSSKEKNAYFRFLPPESTGFIKKEEDQRSDIYSLGVFCYEFLTGEKIFEEKKLNLEEIFHKILTYDFPDRLMKMKLNDLHEIIKKMTEKEMDSRYPDVNNLMKDFQKKFNFSLPSFDKSKIILRPELYQEIQERISNLLKKEKFFFILKGKSGTGKSYILKKIADMISKNKIDYEEIKGFSSYPYSFLDEIKKKLNLKIKDYQKIMDLNLPLLLVENIQRIDESSLNLLLKKKDLKWIGVLNEEESFSFFHQLKIEKETVEIPLFTGVEIKNYINDLLDEKIELREDVVEEILQEAKGNLKTVQIILKFLYESKNLVYFNQKWEYQNEEKLGKILGNLLINNNFDILEDELKLFLKDISIYGFVIDIEIVKKMKGDFEGTFQEIKRLFKLSEEKKILEKQEKNYQFNNQKYYYYFYNLNSEEEKEEKHLAIAKTLERSKGIENKNYALFYHYSHTQEFRKTYIWGKSLVNEMVHQYAYSMAIEVFEKISECFYKIEGIGSDDYLYYYELIQLMMNIYIFKGNYDNFIQILKDYGLETGKNQKNQESLAGINLNLGKFYALKGDFKAAKEWYQKAVQIAENIKNGTLIRNVYENISINYLFSSRFRDAIWYFEKAEKFYHSNDIKESRMLSLLGALGFAYANLGEYKKAEKLLKQVEALIKKEKNPHLKYIGIHYTILVRSRIGNCDWLDEQDALSYLNEVKQQKNKLLEYSLYFSVGYYYYKKGNLAKAFEYVLTSVKIGEKLKMEVGIQASYILLAEIAVHLKKHALFIKVFKKIKFMIKKQRNLFISQWLLRLNALRMSYMVNADEAKIKREILKAIEYSKKLKLKTEIVRNYYTYSVICFNLGEIDKGFSLEEKSLSLFRRYEMKWEEENLKKQILEYRVQANREVMNEKMKFEIIHKVTRLIEKEKDIKELFTEMMDMLIILSGCSKGALFLQKKFGIKLECQIGISGDFKPDESVMKTIHETLKYFVNPHHCTYSYLYLPIVFQERFIGVIYLENAKMKNIFHQELLIILNILSSVFGVLAENASNYKKLQEEKQKLEKIVEERTKELEIIKVKKENADEEKE